MVNQVEQINRPLQHEGNTFRSLVARIPEAVSFAKLETEASREAKTPEGKFALTYLLATRNILRPALEDLTKIDTDLLRPIGGAEYNPERTIDEVGTAVLSHLAQQTNDIPNFWIRIEESGKWDRVAGDASLANGERFAVIDPLDGTSSIPKNNRVQTAGIAIFDRHGTIKAAGIISLVDDLFAFLENRDGSLHIYPQEAVTSHNNENQNTAIRIATLTRRFHHIKHLPLKEHGAWAMDCGVSGYSILGLHTNMIDTIIDHKTGSPWFEIVIWATVAQALGYTITDADGNPFDVAQTIREVTKKEIGNGHRIPIVISRTPEIHKRVLELLKEPQRPGR